MHLITILVVNRKLGACTYIFCVWDFPLRKKHQFLMKGVIKVSFCIIKARLLFWSCYGKSKWIHNKRLDFYLTLKTKNFGHQQMKGTCTTNEKNNYRSHITVHPLSLIFTHEVTSFSRFIFLLTSHVCDKFKVTNLKYNKNLYIKQIVPEILNPSFPPNFEAAFLFLLGFFRMTQKLWQGGWMARSLTLSNQDHG